MNISNKKITPYLELFKHLSPARQKQFFIIIIFNIISALVTSLSISTVIPFVVSLSDPANLDKTFFVFKLFLFLGLNPVSQLPQVLVFFCLTVLFTGIFRILNLWLNSRYSASISCDLSTKCINSLFHSSYENIISTNSDDFLSSITIEGLEIRKVYTAAFQMITNIFIMLSIVITLYFVNSTITTCTIVFITIFYVLIALITKNSLVNIGNLVVIKNKNKTRILQEILGLVDLIILKSREKFYLRKFFDQTRLQGIYVSRFVVYSQFPKFLIESFAIILISIIIFINFNSPNSESFTNILPIFASFTLGAQKLLPLFSQVFGGWTIIANRTSSANTILDLLKTKPAKNNENAVKDTDYCNVMDKKTLLELKDVCFAYEASKKSRLQNINLKIFNGEKIGIIGETGSGKSTLMSLMMGLLIPKKGYIYFQNKDIHLKKNKIYLDKWRKKFSYVPQSIFLLNDSILRNIAFGVNDKEIDFDSVLEASVKSKLNKIIKNSDKGLNSFVGDRGIKLSGGEIQRIGIARAIYEKPQVLFLDEATSSVDNNIEAEIIDQIHNNEDNFTIIMIAHRLSSLKYCDRIIELDKGEIIKIYTNDEFKFKYLS